MGILNFFSKKRAKKLGSWSQKGTTPKWITTPNSSAGVHIDQNNAEELSAVYNAVTLISASIAKMPLIKYTKLADGGKIRDAGHAVHSLFHRKPNKFMTAFEFKERAACDLLLRGNFCAQKVVTPGGGYELLPINPDRMCVEYTTKKGLLKYIYQLESGKFSIFLPDEILHIKGERSDGVLGQSVISKGSGGLSRAYAMDMSASEFFANASIPFGVLEHPMELGKDAQKRLRESVEEFHRGAGKRHRVFVAEEGMKFNPMAFNNTDAQFLESRNFEIEEISRWFNIPPHKLKHLARSTFSNIEHQSLEYYEDTINPWAERITQAVNLSFFSDDSDQFVEFLFDSLLVTDTKTRYEAHNVALQGGWKTRNEIRAIENLNSIDGLDEILVPLNMVSVDEAESVGDDDEAKSAEIMPEQREKLLERAQEGLKLVLLEAISRALRRQKRALQRLVKKEKFTKDLEKFWKNEREQLTQGLIVPCLAYAGLEPGTDPADARDLVSRFVERECSKVEGDLSVALKGEHYRSQLEILISFWDKRTLQEATLERLVIALNQGIESDE